MDILHLVDRLEELFNSGFHIPLTNETVVNEERFLELIDQLRIAIPDEVKKAQQVMTQKERYLAQAQEEAQRTVNIARERVETLVQHDSITSAAESRAEQIVAQARDDAANIRSEADDYVLESLSRLEAEMGRLLLQVRNGITKLNEEKTGQPE
jgi:cell division septum initiation protein DivIVA